MFARTTISRLIFHIIHSSEHWISVCAFVVTSLVGPTNKKSIFVFRGIKLLLLSSSHRHCKSFPSSSKHRIFRFISLLCLACDTLASAMQLCSVSHTQRHEQIGFEFSWFGCKRREWTQWVTWMKFVFGQRVRLDKIKSNGNTVLPFPLNWKWVQKKTERATNTLNSQSDCVRTCYREQRQQSEIKGKQSQVWPLQTKREFNETTEWIEIEACVSVCVWYKSIARMYAIRCNKTGINMIFRVNVWVHTATCACVCVQMTVFRWHAHCFVHQVQTICSGKFVFISAGLHSKPKIFHHFFLKRLYAEHTYTQSGTCDSFSFIHKFFRFTVDGRKQIKAHNPHIYFIIHTLLWLENCCRFKHTLNFDWDK